MRGHSPRYCGPARAWGSVFTGASGAAAGAGEGSVRPHQGPHAVRARGPGVRERGGHRDGHRDGRRGLRRHQGLRWRGAGGPCL
eukprot:1291225-Alexandrium_andersonii.AAC.1